MALFKNLDTVSVSHSPSIVTMALTCIVSEIKYYWSKIAILSYPLAFDTPIRGSLSEYCHNVWYEKTRMEGQGRIQKVELGAK